MNIYSKKLIWKRLLFVAALIIVGASVWYSSAVVTKIAKEEREQARLWAEAIRKKAKLVNYTAQLFQKLRVDERKKVELWKDATELLAKPGSTNINFLTRVIEGNTTVPVLLTDVDSNVISYRNIPDSIANNSEKLTALVREMSYRFEPIEIEILPNEVNLLFYKESHLFEDLKRTFKDLEQSFISEVVSNSASSPVLYTDSTKKQVIHYGNIDPRIIDTPEELAKLISEMESENEPIAVDLGDGEFHYIFYNDSALLKQLKIFPFVQFGVIGLFILIAYILFSTSRNAEQNQVWVGMAKETAHQLGTPLSSIMAWLELIEPNVDASIIKELNKDVNRLNTITDRFSKIGSQPKLEAHDIVEVTKHAFDYMQVRISKKINLSFEASIPNGVLVELNTSLFEWVIENLLKNSIDAMQGGGSIQLELAELNANQVVIDVTDSGKGIPRRKLKTVFQPGYTTKKRGWGLGLSLAKRIIENYHNGKIFVKQSEPNVATTFRIVLNKA